MGRVIGKAFVPFQIWPFMYLIEIFLPLADNDGGRFSPSLFDSVRKTLTATFGGLTAFQRSPAEGTEKKGGHERSDELIVLEVMAHTVDRRWWADYRKHLEASFKQDRVLIRAFDVTLL
jgi:hypothetical protein